MKTDIIVCVPKISWPFFLVSALVHGGAVLYAYTICHGSPQFSEQFLPFPVIDICFESSITALPTLKSLDRAEDAADEKENHRPSKRADQKTQVAAKNTVIKNRTNKKDTSSSAVISDVEKTGVSVRPVYMPQPDYPLDARKAGFEGTVVLTVKVNQAGQVVAVHSVSKNKAPVSVIDAAMNAAKQWQFIVKGSLTGGVAQPTIDVQIPFVFQFGIR